MELTNEFTVGVPVDEAWAVLTDVERIAPCMPGAQLTEVEGDIYRGTVKVKVGPITAQYRGTATFAELDEAGNRAVLRAEGRDVRGQGNASATIVALLEPALEGCRVHLTTDLTVTGKVAQFGRGVLADVSAKLIAQFVSCLEADVLAGADPTGPVTVPLPPPPPPLVLDEPGAAAPPDEVFADSAAPVAPTAEEMVLIDEVVDEAPQEGVPEGVPGFARRSPAPELIETQGPASAAVPSSAPSAGPAAVREVASAEAEPVDLFGAAGGPLGKRLGPVLGVVVVVLWLFRRRRSSR